MKRIVSKFNFVFTEEDVEEKSLDKEVQKIQQDEGMNYEM